MFTRSPKLASVVAVAGWLISACGTNVPSNGVSNGGGAAAVAGASAATAGATTVAGAGSSDGGQTAGAGGTAGSPSASGGGGGAAGLGGGAGTAGVGGAGVSGGGASGAGGGSGSGGGTSGTGGGPPQLDDSLRQRMAAGVAPLQALYHIDTGLFDKNDWWTSGNELIAVIDYTRESGDMQYLADVDNTFVKNQASQFNRYGFYDDDGWWALVWLDAYDLSHDQKYLDMAKTIFTRMAGSWDTKCGGGIYWRNQKDKKNAIPNSLFIQAAAKLHQRTPGRRAGSGSYLDWAQRTWTWFKASGLLNGDQQVVDTLNNLNDCKAEGANLYVQQRYVGGCAGRARRQHCRPDVTRSSRRRRTRDDDVDDRQRHPERAAAAVMSARSSKACSCAIYSTSTARVRPKTCKPTCAIRATSCGT